MSQTEIHLVTDGEGDCLVFSVVVPSYVVGCMARGVLCLGACHSPAIWGRQWDIALVVAQELLSQGRYGVAKFEAEEDLIRGYLRSRVRRIVDDEFSFLEILGPVILTFVDKESEDCLKILICRFGLSVGLRVIGRREK